MKKLFLITALLCCFSFAKAQDATLKETTDWLTAKLKGYFTFEVDNNSIPHSAEYSISFEECICTITVIDTRGDGDKWCLTKETYKYVFNLSDISISSIFEGLRWNNCNQYRVIKLKTYNDNKNIDENYDSNYITCYKDLSSKSNSKTNEAFIPLVLKDNLTYERILKALTHAIKLCGGKEEKF